MSRKLLRSTSLVSTMTLLSRVLGFVRDTLAAQIYGANAGVDAFYVAFKIPNFMRGLFAEGSFSQAFVPVLSEYRVACSHSETRTFLSHIAGSLGAILLILTLLGVLGAPFLVSVFAPGYHQDMERFSAATEMLRITFPYLLWISLTAFAGATLNSYGRFTANAFAPVLLNICLIIAAIYFSHHFALPVMAQAWGVFAAGIVQFLFMLPFLHRENLLTWPRWKWKDPGVQRVLKLMIPALFGASVGQISLLLNTIFASFLAVGSVTWLYYADRLAYFPLGVFGVALATVVLPHLATQHAKKSATAFSQALDWGIRCNLLIGVPAAVAMIVLSQPLVASLFFYGKFSTHDVYMTQQAVMAYSLGLVSFMLVKILSSAFYACHDIKTPVRIAIIALTSNMFLNALLVSHFQHAGLALASSLASWINTFLLLRQLKLKNRFHPQAGWKMFLLRTFLANAILAAFLAFTAPHVCDWLHAPFLHRLSMIAILGLSGILLYLSMLYLSGMRARDFIFQEH